jgi:hypothetical protein
MTQLILDRASAIRQYGERGSVKERLSARSVAWQLAREKSLVPKCSVIQ